MKKKLLCLFFVFLSVMLGFFSYTSVSALELDTSNVYPDNILDYTDLTNISSFDINEKYIAYTLDKSSVTLFEKETRKYSTFDNFSNISKIKLLSNSLIIVDDSGIFTIKDFNKDNTKLLDISMNGVKAMDIYVNSDIISIGLISDNTLLICKYDTDFMSISLPLKVSHPNVNFDSAFLLAITNNSAYVVCKKEITSDNYTTELSKFSLISNTNNNISPISFQANAKILDAIIYNNEECIITLTKENLYFISNQNKTLAQIDISISGDLNSNTFPIFEIKDLQFFNNKIYLADSYYKSIQAVSITKNNENYVMKCDEIILGSNGFDYGRFNKISDIHVQGDNYFVCDSGNNRIQYINNNKATIISILNTITTPTNISLDSNQNLYISCTIDGKNNIVKYLHSAGDYSYSKIYNKISNVNLGKIADMTCNQKDILYMIDYSNNAILYNSENSLNKLDIKQNNQQDILSFNEKSKLVFIKKLQKFAFTINDKIYIMDNDGNIESSFEMSNLREITCDLDKLIAITNNAFITLKFSDNNIEKENQTTFDTSKYSNFNYDILEREIIAFDNNRSCITKITLNEESKPFSFANISDNQSLNSSSQVIPIKTNSIIYAKPYELGNIYNINNEEISAIAIEEYSEYYRVLFNNNEKLESGFIKIQDAQKIAYNYNPISVITTNQVVSIYKYPTILEYNNERIITSTLSINQKITLLYEFPISLDGKKFYTYQNGDKIGFIFNADVVLNENKTIKNLNSENASIHLIGKDNTLLLDKDLKTSIKVLKDSDRIYVESYNKEEKYTKVIIKDSNLNTYEGYVLTTDIQMDKLDNSKIILIIVLIVTLILLAIIITVYIVIKKRNK